MTRINPVSQDSAQDDLKQLYAGIAKHMGGKVPNIFQFMGNSPTVLKGFLAFSDAANHTSFTPQQREQISLVVSEANHCNYCISAHTTLATKEGLPSQQIMQARQGEARDAKMQAILRFAKQAVEKRGKISEQEINQLKKAGVNDKEIVELVLVIGVNMFTNYFNNMLDTPVDFPLAPKLEAAGAGAR